MLSIRGKDIDLIGELHTFEITEWNQNINMLLNDGNFIENLKNIFKFSTDYKLLLNIIITAIINGSINFDNNILPIMNAFKQQTDNSQLLIFKDFSILETCVVLAALKILFRDDDECYFNFDMLMIELCAHKETMAFFRSTPEAIFMKTYQKLCELEVFVPSSITQSTITKYSISTQFMDINKNRDLRRNSFDTSLIRFKPFTSNLYFDYDYFLNNLDNVCTNIPTDIYRWAKDKL
ncbi:unnamed protein product [Gordionus sp. m RMFG-2023]